MPIIDVSLLAGRSAETKRALIRELTDAAERVLGVRREGIRVLLREIPAAHWGVAGEPIEEPRKRGRRKEFDAGSGSSSPRRSRTARS